MNNHLVEKINNEITRIDKLFNDAEPLFTLCKIKEPDFIIASATALLLHSFYNGIESIALIVLKNIDGQIPSDARWHKALFETLFIENDKRKNILRKEIKEPLEKYLYFRHFIRHSYGSEIDWEQLNPLINNVKDMWAMIKEDFKVFIMEDTVSILKECGALLEGHFLLSSGRHSDKYFQCARLLQYPDRAEKVLRPVADKILADISAGVLPKIDAVVGPAMGGIVVAYELGRLLRLPAFFTERNEEGKMSLRRGFEVRQGENILIAEDVVTTGKSSLESIAVLEAAGAKTQAIACVVDRREKNITLELPLYASAKVSASNFDKNDCELCKQGIPFVKPGSRKL
ncbi:hypothetical protein AGMMS50212_10070 [Spirochaetia bacterium]|nr:hypothetical protein AGMMS50212_09990 [Spirochaetia bacterium]GHV83667.1 hypothetical protein AGMMS50212_10070 [Spirochaetia bacterium]